MTYTSSKTFLRPLCVRAEHSTYFTAFSSEAKRVPCSYFKGFCPLFATKKLNIYKLLLDAIASLQDTNIGHTPKMRDKLFLNSEEK